MLYFHSDDTITSLFVLIDEHYGIRVRGLAALAQEREGLWFACTV